MHIPGWPRVLLRADNMNPTLFLLGPSDDEARNPSTREHVQGGVKVTTSLSGLLPILPYVSADPDLSPRSTMVLVGVHEIRIPANTQVNLFNLVGDADSSQGMLQRIQMIADQIRPWRYFNPAENILTTARGQLPTTLANIPGCILPCVESVSPVNFSEFCLACEKFDSWPLIVRAIGYSGGANMVLLNSPSELESLRDQSWLYGGILLVQYIDCRDEDGLYNKTRVIVVDGVPYPRHSIYSDQWLSSTASRAWMDSNVELCQREERFLAYLRDEGMKQYGPVFREINQRIGLDIFGIDFALVNGQMVIFEANACMTFLRRRRWSRDPRYDYLDTHITALWGAVKTMLLNA